MSAEKVFRTKTGYCHLLQDKIVLTRDGVIGDIAKLTIGNNIAQPLIIYAVISIALGYLAINSFEEGQKVPALLFAVGGTLLIVAILASLNNSATPVIDKSRIQYIEFKKAIPVLTRAHFIIHFQTERGRRKKRLIMLPGSLTDGQTETVKAVQIMKEEFGHIKNAS